MSETGENNVGKWNTLFNEILEIVFEHSLIGMAVLDSDGKFLKVNKKACEIWEYNESELIGKTWRDITHPDDMRISSHYVESYKKKSSNFNLILEKRYVTGHGNTKICKITTSVYHNKDTQEIEFFFTQIEDVTHKREALNSIQKGIEFIKNRSK